MKIKYKQLKGQQDILFGMPMQFPLTVELTLENVEEVKYMWLATNLGKASFQKVYKDDPWCFNCDKILDRTQKYSVWDFFDSILKYWNIKI